MVGKISVSDVDDNIIKMMLIMVNIIIIYVILSINTYVFIWISEVEFIKIIDRIVKDNTIIKFGKYTDRNSIEIIIMIIFIKSYNVNDVRFWWVVCMCKGN